MNAPDKLAIAVAQLNATVGDIAGNAERARRARREAAAAGADIVVFPELFIAGYPPEDLVLKPAFQSACRTAIETLARETGDGGPALLIGTPWNEDGGVYQQFDGGVIISSDEGTFVVWGKIRDKWNELGGNVTKPYVVAFKARRWSWWGI